MGLEPTDDWFWVNLICQFSIVASWGFRAVHSFPIYSTPAVVFQSFLIARSIQYAGLLLSETLGNPHHGDIFLVSPLNKPWSFRTFRDEPFYPLFPSKIKDASATIGQRLSSNVFDLEVAFLLPLSLARTFKKSGTVYSCTLSEQSSVKVVAVLTHQEPTRSNVFFSEIYLSPFMTRQTSPTSSVILATTKAVFRKIFSF